ncbi:MAG: hypothetical protein NXI13_00205 [Proteobacteria bacterium]|nr:hypothetical protein [Pseudomonadota bacterium]
MTIELEVDHIGSAGDGVAFHKGQSVFVPYSAPGDRVTVELGEPRGKGLTATITELISPGADRTEPSCRHFGTCGGCALQHLTADFNANWKRQRIIDCLDRVGLKSVDVENTVTSPPQSRRRVEFIASKRKKGVMVGYHLRRSNQIFDAGACPVLQPELLALLNPLRKMLPEILPRKSIARVTATMAYEGIDILITANIDDDLCAREILAKFATDNKLSRLSIRRKKGEAPEVIAAPGNSEISLGQVMANLAPGGFLQATIEGEHALTDRAKDALKDARNIVDLFSGCGSFSFPLVGEARILAVDEDEGLISALRQTANKNILPITSERRDLFQRPLLAEELAPFDGLIFDPPRAGAAAQAEQIAMSDIETVVAVSCNPVSFARDIKLLTDGGYEIASVLPVDQFLWSPHVEMVAVLSKK